MSTHSGPGDDGPDPGLSAIIGERRQLINLTYRLLGSLAEAEDVERRTPAGTPCRGNSNKPSNPPAVG